METKANNDQNFGALDLGGTFLKFCYGNSKNGIIFDSKIPIVNPQSSESLLNTISLAICEIHKHDATIKYFGMGSPGTVNTELGIVCGVSPNLPCLLNLQLKKEIEERNHIHLLIENDANLMTLAQTYFHPNHSILGITIGTGIGSGFVNKNGIFHGEEYSAMEMGHTIVVSNGRKCKCGKQGCVEAYSSANSIFEIINEKFPELIVQNIGEIYHLSLKNAQLKDELDYLNSLLALAIANSIMLLNPSVVTIGGGVVEIDAFDFIYLKKRILDNLLGVYNNCKIEKAALSNKAGIFGGIILAENAFSGI